MNSLELSKSIGRLVSRRIKTPFQKRLWKIFVFLVRFIALSLPLHFLLWLNFDATSVQLFVAKTIESALLLTGAEVSRSGIFLTAATKTGPLVVEIIKDCVGWKSVLALFGLIFATREIGLKKRVLGFLVGAPVIFFGNILRIYATILTTISKGLEFWEITHGILWQEGLIVLVIATWYIWLNICKRSRN